MTINPKRQRRGVPPRALVTSNTIMYPSYDGQELRRRGGVEVKRFEARQRPRLWADNPIAAKKHPHHAAASKRRAHPVQSPSRSSSSTTSRRVKKLARALPTRSADTTTNKRKRRDISELSVTFSEPLVSKIWVRPFTSPEDKSALFYSKGDIAQFRQEYNKWQIWSDDYSDDDDYSSSEEEEEDYENEDMTHHDDGEMVDAYDDEEDDDDDDGYELDGSVDSLTSEDSLSDSDEENYPAASSTSKKTLCAAASVVPRNISASRLCRDVAADAPFPSPSHDLVHGGL